MKSAKEWSDVAAIFPLDVNQNSIEYVEQIQLDAAKAGFELAKKGAVHILSTVDYHSSDTSYNRMEYMRDLGLLTFNPADLGLPDAGFVNDAKL